MMKKDMNVYYTDEEFELYENFISFITGTEFLIIQTQDPVLIGDTINVYIRLTQITKFIITKG